MQNECCICLNPIYDSNIFILECCKNAVHHDCIVTWINTNINKNLPDYNKCILCKTHNKIIDEYYNNLLNIRNNNTYIDLDNSNNNLIIVNNDNVPISNIYYRNLYFHRNNKIIIITIVFTCIFIYFVFVNNN